VSAYGIGILGMGRALGSRVHTNEELCATTLPGTTPQWIVDKTGIRRRYVVDENETSSSLTLASARRALESAGVTPDQIAKAITPKTRVLIFNSRMGITDGDWNAFIDELDSSLDGRFARARRPAGRARTARR